MTLLYNLVMLAVDVLAVRLLLQRKGLIAWCEVMTFAGMAAVVLGLVLGLCFENHFGVFRYWSYGVFLHGVVLLFATAFLWRKSRPVSAVGAVLSAVATVLIAIDAFLIEPHWLEVTHLNIASPKIHKPVRIVVVADLQTDRVGEYETDVLRRTLDEKPDIILFAGDYIQSLDHGESLLELRALLREMEICANSRVFAIGGNMDGGSEGPSILFKDTGVTVAFVSQSFDLPEFRLTCLDWFDSCNTSLAIANPTPDRFHLVMGHSPNYALGKIDADLLVAGHTHGGQVRIPGIGPLIIHSRIPFSWAAGLTDLPGGGKLLVSRGIGMERGHAPRMRFLCRPELVVIDLIPE